jgi:hypothetical protein
MNDDIVETLTKRSKCNGEEACEAFLSRLFNKYQNSFFSFALNTLLRNHGFVLRTPTPVGLRT